MLLSQMLTLVLSLAILPVEQPGYRAQIEQWRQQHEEGLRSDTGWLTVAGLFWLKEGESSVGAGRTNTFVLPPGSAPDIVGTFDFRGGHVTFHAAPGVAVTVNGKPAATTLLADDSAGSPDVLRLGSLSMFVETQAQGWAAFFKDNKGEMARVLGRDPTDAEGYLGHHFGSVRAARMMKMDPNTPVDEVFTPQEMAMTRISPRLAPSAR